MAGSYTGPVRIYGDDGILLTTGTASLEVDSDMATWQGSLQTLKGTGVAGKALVVTIEIPDGEGGLAQLTPAGEVGEMANSSVSGLGPRPF